MRLPLSYRMIVHAACASILTMACDPEHTTQPVQPNPAGATDPVKTNAVGTLEVTVTTSGSDLDPNGYVILGTRSSDAEGFSLYGTLPVNGTATFFFVPADTYKIRLAGVAPNCDLVTSAPQQFVVAKATKLSIDIECTESLQLTYSLSAGYKADDSVSLTGQLWTIDLTGRNATRLTTDRASHETPVWSPDGSRLAFVSNRSGHAGIWIMEGGAGEAIPLNTGLGENFGPRWSPDGQRLVFFSPVEGMTQLFSVKADGTDLRAITTGSPGDYDPDWSPDGRKIVFASKRDNMPGIWIVNADGTAPIRITDKSDSNPRWSPDGVTIAFSRLDGINHYWLYTMNTDGSALTFRGGLAYPARSSWSPNGRKLAFASDPCARDTCYQFIQFVGLDGTGYPSIGIPGVTGDVAWRQRR